MLALYQGVVLCHLVSIGTLAAYRPSDVDFNAQANRKISLKNRKIAGRLGFRRFQPEMRGAALAGFDEQIPFDHIHPA